MTTTAIVQLAAITLKPEVDEAALVKASDAFEEAFVNKQRGILRRYLLRSGAGGYADLVFFESKEAADKVLENELTSPACAAYFSLMEVPADEAPDMGVQGFEIIKTYG